MTRPVSALLAATAATAIAVGVGVAVSDPEVEAPPAATVEPAPSIALADYDTSTVTLVRSAFCDDVAPLAVERALGSEPHATESYGNGESARITAEVTDIAHEFSCLWTSGDATARAWLFAPPVTPKQASTMAGRADAGRRCDALPSAPSFGTPSAAAVCTSSSAREVSFRGLFGDAWLTCTLELASSARVPTAEQTERAGRWCVAVAQAASVGDRADG